MPTRDQYFAAGRKVASEQGLNEDKTKVLLATIQSEAGWLGVGDKDRSAIGSFGPLQFFGPNGMLAGFAAFLGLGQIQAGQIAINDPEKALTWAVQPGGYYRTVLDAGYNQGLRGADLAYYVQRYAQRSDGPTTWQAAANNYNALFGPQPSIPMPGTVQPPSEGGVQVPSGTPPANGGQTPSLDFGGSLGFLGTKLLIVIAALVFFFLGVYLLASGNNTVVKVTKNLAESSE